MEEENYLLLWTHFQLPASKAFHRLLCTGSCSADAAFPSGGESNWTLQSRTVTGPSEDAF